LGISFFPPWLRKYWLVPTYGRCHSECYGKRRNKGASAKHTKQTKTFSFGRDELYYITIEAV
jgi:hypothetical protein